MPSKAKKGPSLPKVKLQGDSFSQIFNHWGTWQAHSTLFRSAHMSELEFRLHSAKLLGILQHSIPSPTLH